MNNAKFKVILILLSIFIAPLNANLDWFKSINLTNKQKIIAAAGIITFAALMYKIFKNPTEEEFLNQIDDKTLEQLQPKSIYFGKEKIIYYTY